MTDKAAVRAEGLRLQAAMLAAGAVPVDADILQPADTLLDLYGEDIRARAFVTSDPLRGEMMLRPDFTLPVVLGHMENGAEPARYTYLGEVFRKQEHRGPRRAEFFQLGYEVFARDDPAARDAEVFALFAGLLAPLALRPVTGDFGILIAAVHGLHTTDRRKGALMRHLWRPRRFRALLDRFGGRSPVPPVRAALVATLNAGKTPDAAAPWIGLRGEEEMQARMAALVEDAATSPIAAEEVTLLETILALAAPCPQALTQVEAMARDFPALRLPAERLKARLDALSARGIVIETLDFEASYGRTTLEYYDGFVFGFYAETRPDLPPVASGGRYDALTARLGRGASIPAVGGVIRPGLTLQLRGAA